MYDGNLDDVTATRAWVDARKLPLVPALDAALGAEYLAASSDKLVVLLIADPADPTTAELMCVHGNGRVQFGKRAHVLRYADCGAGLRCGRQHVL